MAGDSRSGSAACGAGRHRDFSELLLAHSGAVAGYRRPAGEDRGAWRFHSPQASVCSLALPFPERLEQVLREQGFAVTIANAGVRGDTVADGLRRLDSSVPEGTDAVIIELGPNDAERA